MEQNGHVCAVNDAAVGRKWLCVLLFCRMALFAQLEKDNTCSFVARNFNYVLLPNECVTNKRMGSFDCHQYLEFLH